LEEKLLYKLKKFIIRFYNKKVEFNIVNLKSIIFHSDIFTKILTSKLKRKRVGNILFKMDVILNRISLADSLEKIVDDKNARIKKDLNLLENKYKNLNINSILVLEKKNLSQLLSKLYYNVIIRLIKDKKNYKNKKINKYYYKIYEIIFNSINYKNISGLRLEAKGRLTKRYRADRAVFKLR
jgi:DNA polymerase III delta prime subunit